MRSIKALTMAALAVAGVAATMVTGASSASAQDYGPDTCLQGYVWREAVTGDHVCVTPATRSQAWSDNAQATARRSPTGGPYGPDTCLQGYVWREAVAGDHVCVIPATRSQAGSDNAQAANRRASLNIWTTRWYSTGNCGESCVTSDAGVPHITINGDHFNVGGRVWLGYYRLNSDQLIRGYWVNATPHPGFPGGSFALRTDMLDCGKGAATAYIRSYDQTSGRWSSRLNIHTGCVHP
ncbi:MAG: hypothetical protein ACRDRI_04780 [Pseudonocardiaceae bacterium]